MSDADDLCDRTLAIFSRMRITEIDMQRLSLCASSSRCVLDPSHEYAANLLYHVASLALQMQIEREKKKVETN